MKQKIIGLFVFLSMGFASQVNAATVEYSYSNGSTVVAEGFFSYADGSTGVLGYGDLTDFSITIIPTSSTFDLAFAIDPSRDNSYRHFAYDLAAGQFNSRTFGGLEFLLGAFISNEEGFVVQKSLNGAPLLKVMSTLGYQAFDYDRFTIDHVSAVPLPAAFPLFLAALGGLGFVARRRKARHSLQAA
jgi:PEP-CTERM motif-containing protein